MLHVVADENMPAVEALLGDTARVTRCNGRRLTARELGDADVLFVRSVTPVNSELLSGTPVRFVGTATSGFEHIDIDYLQQRGIGFARAEGANANSVVEYVLSALAATSGGLEKLVAGGSAGVIGHGFVGRAVAHRLRTLGAHCLVYDPWLEQEQLPGHASLDEVLACELVCLHPELTRREPWPSYHLLGQRELAGLQGHQLLINASRGAVVDNLALRQRLEQANAPQVVLDVWENEPELDTGLLAAVDLGTAHIAGYSLDGKVLATRMLCEALAQALDVSLPRTHPLPVENIEYNAGEQLEGAALVVDLMGRVYDIRDDDRRLRAACASAGAVGAAFDALRKHYPERRELAGHIVANVTSSQRDIVLALGCIPG